MNLRQSTRHYKEETSLKSEHGAINEEKGGVWHWPLRGLVHLIQIRGHSLIERNQEQQKSQQRDETIPVDKSIVGVVRRVGDELLECFAERQRKHHVK